MLHPAILSPREAVDMIPSGATIAASSFVTIGLPHVLHTALCERFDETSEPRDLSCIHAAGQCENTGLDALTPRYMVRRAVGGHWGLVPAMRQAISEERSSQPAVGHDRRRALRSSEQGKA